MRTKLGMLAAGLGLFCLAAPVVAHHGFDTEYDSNKKISLTGVVSKVEWTNPHMHVYIDVTDARGNMTTYNMELTSPNSVQRQGWGRSSLLPGEKVIFEGYGGKVVETRGALAKIAKVETPDKPLFVQGGPEAQ
ncbi:MAG: hypothetical protein A3H97_22750 [Acidobacteria bacterium RIFCSPLOWO2_02_FULL_65_29]|nr:MAG: hypothetical protein A3H97_22750 [Acidobacteria bacterium RIFCSPLOWO2_02_FULL_65_29]